MIYSDSIMRVMAEAEDATLTLLTLAAEVKDENQVYIRVSDLMETRGVSRATIERHLKKLRDLGIIVPDPKDRNVKRGVHMWRIAPRIVWIGKKHERIQYEQELGPEHPFHRWAAVVQDIPEPSEPQIL